MREAKRSDGCIAASHEAAIPSDEKRPHARKAELDARWTGDATERLILEYALKTDGELSRQDVERVLSCGRDTALKVLNGLVERGIMAKDGKARATRYHIIEAKGA